MTDSLNLVASSAYGKILNQNIAKTITPQETRINQSEAINFQDMVQVKFNSFSNLSPAEILNRVSGARYSKPSSADEAVSINISQSVAKEIKNVRDTLTKQEIQAQKAAIGEANIVELMATSTKAKALLSTMVAIKDEAKTAWDKIWSMSI